MVLSALCCIVLLCRAGFCVVFSRDFSHRVSSFLLFFSLGPLLSEMLFFLCCLSLLYPYPMCYDETAVWRAQQALNTQTMFNIYDARGVYVCFYLSINFKLLRS